MIRFFCFSNDSKKTILITACMIFVVKSDAVELKPEHQALLERVRAVMLFVSTVMYQFSVALIISR